MRNLNTPPVNCILGKKIAHSMDAATNVGDASVTGSIPKDSTKMTNHWNHLFLINCIRLLLWD